MLTKKDSLKEEKAAKGLKTAAYSSPSSDSLAKNSSQSSIKSSPLNSHHFSNQYGKNFSNKTKVYVKCDVGFSNQLTIRGEGANLNWDKGIALKNIKNDEWVWETDIPFQKCEFKVLINDRQYELGTNHLLQSGSTIHYTPFF